MKIISNKHIPVKGFKAMAIYPFIFVRSECKMRHKDWNHEKIHFAQQKELWLIGFYVLYLIYWLRYGYRNIPFEKEAYIYEGYNDYLQFRAKFAWRDIHKNGY